ncbi:ferredoxin--NADP(+) reductase [Paraphotobacterium marinum]|uniref:ferredoxin--NADP(+) reductase n=1 Tax=Paraphotobacterium marinum TaxID=1755811 RepID=A0A220VCH9_9GAMM|nr:ferredoxin--NADP reductase [Paraphotobacterium marinum]ASK78039.1 ferredoxin--NADP(+) reductase [Paraphotobacterium marinum]
MSNWIEATVVENYKWTHNLFSLKIKANIDKFIAGQYTKLGLKIDDNIIQRAYSFVNKPQSSTLEIYITTVNDGLLSPQLEKLQKNDKIMITQHSNGFFTINEVPKSKDLWMIASGTAIGPYLSILNDDSQEVWHKYENIFIIHSVRYGEDLSYQKDFMAIQNKKPHAFKYIPFVSREDYPIGLRGRVTTALENGGLESYANTIISPENSQVMLCGNPELVRDAKALLEKKGLRKNLRRKPGHITMEHYW